MILPTTRWYGVAAGLAALALLALHWPAAAGVLFVADFLWVLALGLDAWRNGALDLAGFPVTREAPPAFSVGRPMPVVYHWHNTSRRALRMQVREVVVPLLELAGAGDRRLMLPAGESLNDEALFTPVRRGKARGGTLHLRVLGPWGLAWRQGKREVPWHVTVYPSLRTAALRALPAQAQRRRDAGFRNLRRIGEGRIFESLKDWVPGDEPRVIDWKATARRGKLMSRQYEDERRQQVMIVIDAGRLLTAEIDGRPRLEAAIDAALELAHSAVLHDDNVGLLVFADDVLQYVPPGRGRRALRQVLDALAEVAGRLVEPNYPAAFAYLATRHRKRALTVLFTDVVDATASDALVAQAASLRPRHLPLAVTLRDPALERLATTRPATTNDAFQRAAAEELLEAREKALAELRSAGVLVLDVLPDGAARAVVEQYERLKRRAMV
ncbi:MAG TPA: DUF58 domain-containing protein [Gemmatimonadales bacterium]|jgi:uncharacterized protein (DUF58 family)